MYTIRHVNLETHKLEKILDDWSNHRIATNLTLACRPPISTLSLDDMFELIVAAGDDVNVSVGPGWLDYRKTYLDYLFNLDGHKNIRMIHFMLKYSCAWGSTIIVSSISSSCKEPGLSSVLLPILSHSQELENAGAEKEQERWRHYPLLDSQPPGLMWTWNSGVSSYRSKRPLCLNTLDILVSTGYFLGNECYDELHIVRGYIFGHDIFGRDGSDCSVENSFLLDAIIIGYF